jgi:hypothetical protein
VRIESELTLDKGWLLPLLRVKQGTVRSDMEDEVVIKLAFLTDTSNHSHSEITNFNIVYCPYNLGSDVLIN